MLTGRTALLLLGAAVALAIVANGSAALNAPTHDPTIGTAASLEYRVVVTARETSAGDAPTAQVTATIYTRAKSQWQRASSTHLPGTYFWKTVTGPHALCRLEIATTDASATMKPRAIIQVLVSPSTGCGRSKTMALPA